MPRITAVHMLRSTITTVSASATSSFRGSLPHPTQQLCTLRVRHYCRLTQHSLPGGRYGLTRAGLAPADRASFRWRLQLVDHLIGPQHDRWGYRKAKRLGGLEVHDHLVFRRKLHREIARLLASHDAIDVSGGTTPDVYLIGSVGEQTALSGKVRLRIDRRYVVSGRRRYDRYAMRNREYSYSLISTA